MSFISHASRCKYLFVLWGHFVRKICFYWEWKLISSRAVDERNSTEKQIKCALVSINYFKLTIRWNLSPNFGNFPSCFTVFVPMVARLAGDAFPHEQLSILCFLACSLDCCFVLCKSSILYLNRVEGCVRGSSMSWFHFSREFDRFLLWSGKPGKFALKTSKSPALLLLFVHSLFG